MFLIVGGALLLAIACRPEAAAIQPSSASANNPSMSPASVNSGDNLRTETSVEGGEPRQDLLLELLAREIELQSQWIEEQDEQKRKELQQRQIAAREQRMRLYETMGGAR